MQKSHRVKSKLFILLLGMLTASNAPSASAQTCVDGSPCNPSTLNNIVFAYQMKCDGMTNDTSALQSAITSAGSLGAHVIVPPGVCITNAAVTLPDNIWLQGAGKFGTTIRRKSSTNSSSHMFTLSGSMGSVVITDLTIDYNKSGQTSGSDTIGSTATTINGFTLQRTQIINSWNRAIAFVYTGSNFLASIVIADNDFANNGTSNGTVGGDVANGDVAIVPAAGLRVVNNRANSTNGSFFLSGTGGNTTGMGNIVISGNVVNGTLGFAVALGGGGPGTAGGAGVTIQGNVFNMPGSRENIVDLAYWRNVVVDGNYIVAGSCGGVSCGGIGDAPPANQITVSNNTIIGNSTNASNNCISLGGADENVVGNFCSGAGGSGIVLIGESSGSTGSIISNNTVKDCNKAASGNHSGIDLYLPSGTSMSDVVVTGNHTYDDQGASATQTYGIGFETNGSNTNGFSNITIKDNDVHKNKTAGILNNTAGSTGIAIFGNPGDDPLTDASLTLTGRTASIAFTYLYCTGLLTPPPVCPASSTNGAGMYRISIDLIITTAGSGGSIYGLVQGSNGVGPSLAVVTPTINLSSLGETSATGVIYLTNNVAAQYQTVMSTGSGAQYTLRIKCEYLGP